MIPFTEALAQVLASVVPLSEQETLPLSLALGRSLAKDSPAKLTQPPFAAAAMDGYALKASEAVEGAEFRMIGMSAAGAGFSGCVRAGEAVRIFTGAPVPEGADTIVPQEEVIVSSQSIQLRHPAKPEAHIRVQGNDFHKGDILLTRGTCLDARALALAAAMGWGELPVLRRPRIALLATGDELIPAGSVPGPDQIIASGLYGIAALAREAGAEVREGGIAGDTREALHTGLDTLEAGVPDLIVTIGGVSVGDHDLVRPVLEARGFSVTFHTIAMKPGKPMLYAKKGSLMVLGLPGNPVSAFLCAALFLVPMLHRLLGERDSEDLSPLKRSLAARLAVPVPANGNRLDFQRAKIVGKENGIRLVEPYAKQDSASLSQLHQADSLVLRPPLAPAAHAGEACRILLLRDLTVRGMKPNLTKPDLQE
jgi:molybdopterin molybdotransferase